MFMFFIKHFVSQFLGYESTRGLGTNRPKVGTKRLSLGTKRLGTKRLDTVVWNGHFLESLIEKSVRNKN